MMMGMQIWMGNGRIMMGDANLDCGIPMVDAKWGMGMKMGNNAKSFVTFFRFLAGDKGGGPYPSVTKKNGR